MIVIRLVKCKYCGELINREKEEFEKTNNGYAHKNCYLTEEQDRKLLCNYITEIFHFKAPGPVNMALIKKYHTENKYSYKSMYFALKYYFEVQHGSIEKAGGRIGILPYVYDDAKKYYEKLSRKQNNILKVVEKELQKNKKIVIVTQQRNNKKWKEINLEDI